MVHLALIRAIPHTCSHPHPQDGTTALIRASKNSNTPVAKVLLEHFADVNAVDKVSARVEKISLLDRTTGQELIYIYILTTPPKLVHTPLTGRPHRPSLR